MILYQLKLRLLINKFCLLLLLFFFSAPNLKADIQCDNLNDINKIDTIEINFKKNRKWITNLLEHYTLSELNKREWNINFFLDKKYKKRFKADIKFYYDNNKDCTLPASIRTHGDYTDHISYKNSHITSSLNIKLEKGNVNNIVRFLLLLPETRKNDNEIFLSALMNELGFMSPRTLYKNVSINGHKQIYIFQEYIGKEFLEYNDKVEGPILEGHEVFEPIANNIRNSKTRTGFSEKKPYLTKISNSNWIKDSDEKFISSLNALNALNLIYMKDPTIYRGKYSVTSVMEIDPTLFSKFENKYNNTYEAIMSALDSTHNLTRDDRRFYYDPIYDEFYNIYYDGSSNILTDYEMDPLLYDFEIALKYNGYKKKNLNWHPAISEKAKLGATDAINLIKSIDIKKLEINLKKNGLDIKNYEIMKIIESILNRLEKIKKANVEKKDYILQKSFFNNFKENFYNNEKLLFINYNKNNDDEYDFSFDQCDIELISCKTIKNIDFKNRQKIIDASFKNEKNEKRNIYVARSISDYKEGKISRDKFGIRDFTQYVTEDKNVFIATNEYVNLIIDEKNRNIFIKNLNWQARSVIFKSNLKNWNIIMQSSKINTNKEINIFNKNNLTGCLTIIDTEIENVSLEINGSQCEDAVNFIRSNGSLKNIYIENTMKDSLDADFSDLNFKNILIKNSNNDCLDFSYGNYSIDYAAVDRCYDKGISVGEKSNVKVTRALIQNTNIGIASKDSSDVKINKLQIKNTDTCISAYKKKQEFDGGAIDIKNFKCTNFIKKINKDLFSSIYIKNDLINQTN